MSTATSLRWRRVAGRWQPIGHVLPVVLAATLGLLLGLVYDPALLALPVAGAVSLGIAVRLASRFLSLGGPDVGYGLAAGLVVGLGHVIGWSMADSGLVVVATTIALALLLIYATISVDASPRILRKIVRYGTTYIGPVPWLLALSAAAIAGQPAVAAHRGILFVTSVSFVTVAIVRSSAKVTLGLASGYLVVVALLMTSTLLGVGDAAGRLSGAAAVSVHPNILGLLAALSGLRIVGDRGISITSRAQAVVVVVAVLVLTDSRTALVAFSVGAAVLLYGYSRRVSGLIRPVIALACLLMVVASGVVMSQSLSRERHAGAGFLSGREGIWTSHIEAVAAGGRSSMLFGRTDKAVPTIETPTDSLVAHNAALSVYALSGGAGIAVAAVGLTMLLWHARRTGGWRLSMVLAIVATIPVESWLTGLTALPFVVGAEVGAADDSS